MNFENVNPNDLDDTGREYLAALRRDDEGAKQLEEIWGLAKESCAAILQESAEMYAAMEVADFWKAKRHAERIKQMNDLNIQGIEATIGNGKRS